MRDFLYDPLKQNGVPIPFAWWSCTVTFKQVIKVGFASFLILWANSSVCLTENSVADVIRQLAVARCESRLVLEGFTQFPSGPGQLCASSRYALAGGERGKSYQNHILLEEAEAAEKGLGVLKLRGSCSQALWRGDASSGSLSTQAERLLLTALRD